jgi:2-polyprenyl-3-methyl-5-hydroxy-6-metoxy-1,4-benzoquinol methylase
VPDAAHDFEARYRADADPFGVHTRWYERRKTTAVGAVLAGEHYATVWDAACGVGQVAASLVSRCDRLVATDLSPRAVELAAEHLQPWRHAATTVNVLPEVPEAARGADLVVLAEVLYYLPETDRAAVAAAVSALPLATEVVAVSWRHAAEDTWTSGTESLAELGDALTLTGWKEHTWLQDPDFEIRTWVR